jgi:hypothetical protein
MCRTRDLQNEIKKTSNDWNKNYRAAHQPLESPDCYALPLIAFVLGLAFHKTLPSPSKILAITGRFFG